MALPSRSGTVRRARNLKWWPVGVNPGSSHASGPGLLLRLGDPLALPLLDEVSLHLGDHAEHGERDPAGVALGGDGWVEHCQRSTTLVAFVDDVENVEVYRGGKIRHDRAAIAKMKAEGRGVTEIAKTLGMSRMQVYRVVRIKDAGRLG